MEETYTLWEHQKHTIRKGLSDGSLALLQDPGVGKTLSMIKIIEGLWAREGVQRTVIFCPLSVVPNWKNEWLKFSNYGASMIYTLDGTLNKRLKTLETIAFSKVALVMNYEAIQNDKIFNRLMKWAPNIVVCDESHRMKNPQAKRTKRVTTLSDLADHKYIMTGTPVLNGLMDIFQQYRILDGGETFGRNFFVFRANYFEDKNASWAHSPQHFPVWQPRKARVDELLGKINEKAVKVRKDECLDLPPLVQKNMVFEMAPDQRKAYESMRDDLIAFIKSDHEEPQAVVAQYALHRALRLQQIACGFATTDEGDTVKFKKNPRLSLLADLLEDVTPYHKVIVWAHFQANQDDICKLLDKAKINYVTLFGRTKDRQGSIDAFQNDEKVRVIVANQASGGIGINLQEASYSIYYSKGFSLEHDVQSVARNYRGGSEKHEKVTRIDIVAEDSIDEMVNEALQTKIDVSNQVFSFCEKI